MKMPCEFLIHRAFEFFVQTDVYKIIFRKTKNENFVSWDEILVTSLYLNFPV